MLQPLGILKKYREVVNMDAIFVLTPSTHDYDAIFVYVDKLSKMTTLCQS